jgi:superfamily I DNA and RNA helicase
MNETWWLGEDQLDDDQKKIIALKLKGSHVITGPPGSGKTNLLLLRAKYIACCPSIVVATSP